MLRLASLWGSFTIPTRTLRDTGVFRHQNEIITQIFLGSSSSLDSEKRKNQLMHSLVLKQMRPTTR